MSQDYNAAQITVLKGLEGVRHRPAMYVGSTGNRGLHHILTEVIDNSIDEVFAGVCTDIHITLLPGTSSRSSTTAAASRSISIPPRSAPLSKSS